MGSIYFTAFLLLFWDVGEIGKNVSIITSVIASDGKPLRSESLSRSDVERVCKIACITAVYIIACIHISIVIKWKKVS